MKNLYKLHAQFDRILGEFQDEHLVMKDLFEELANGYVLSHKDHVKRNITEEKTSLAKALLFLEFVKRLTKSHKEKDFNYTSDAITLFYVVRRLICDMYNVTDIRSFNMEMVDKISRHPYFFAFLLHTTNGVIDKLYDHICLENIT